LGNVGFLKSASVFPILWEVIMKNEVEFSNPSISEVISRERYLIQRINKKSFRLKTYLDVEGSPHPLPMVVVELPKLKIDISDFKKMFGKLPKEKHAIFVTHDDEIKLVLVPKKSPSFLKRPQGQSKHLTLCCKI
jgi:hypothetical protein